MSSTRKASPGGPLRQERYCSSQQFERGLMANLVARRCSVLETSSERALVNYVQLVSHSPGGLHKFADELVATFPTDVGSKWVSSGSYVENIDDLNSERLEDGEAAKAISEALEELALNPEVKLDEFSPKCFPPLVDRIGDMQRRKVEACRKSFVVTEVGQLIYETLDYTCESGCMSLVDGVARTGKTFAAKAWCQENPGAARYVQVPSTNDDIGFFRAIAKGIGVSVNLNSKAQELRQRIEEALQIGGITVVFDEAHYLWPNSLYRDALPGRINWIMTALVNFGVPVCLVTTPQFIRSQKKIESKSSWTSEQFIGRIGHYQKLPQSLSETDLTKVAKSLHPAGTDPEIEILVRYAQGSAKYLAGIESLMKRARYLAGKAQRTKVTFADIKRAIRESVIPSDTALSEAMAEPVKRGRTRAAMPLQPTPRADQERAGALTTNETALAGRGITPARTEQDLIPA